MQAQTSNTVGQGEAGVAPFSARAPALSLPKGGGAIKGIGEKFAANPVTGTGSLSVPIATAPGRGGFAPELVLTYDSGAGNGPFGLGWSLSLPSISRKTEKGLPRYRDAEASDVFILSGAEDLVPTGEITHGLTVYGKLYDIESFRPRVEGLFARIERWAEVNHPEAVFWRTISRDNVTSWYGRSANSCVADPADPARIFQWLICQRHDDKGNVIDYHYDADDPDELARDQVWERNRTRQQHTAYRYPSEMLYGNRHPFMPDLDATGTWPQVPPDEWFFRTIFDYGNPHAPMPPARSEDVLRGRPFQRLDAFSNYRAGFELRCHRLCWRILTYHCFESVTPSPMLIRATEFGYRDVDEALLRAPLAGGYATLGTVTQRAYEFADSAYRDRALPPISLTYSQAGVVGVPREITDDALANLPVGTQGAGYQWVDLDGEGLSGVLHEQQGGWYYKPNRGNGEFGAQRLVAPLPSLALGASSRHQFLDLAGDGSLDVVDFAGTAPGFYERDCAAGWRHHVPFANLPNIDWNDANLRFVDLTGDGHADALITEDEVLSWHASLGEAGFGHAERKHQAADENVAPRLLFSEAEQTVFLADMSGDGLTDLVRIRNGEVCYWPNLGYGRFGRKLVLGNSPRFDHPELFDPRRIRLADTDGSGPVDIIYLGRNGASLFFNRSGNCLSDPLPIALPVATENLPAVQVADLLGNGTACLVWNSHLPRDTATPVRYIDLMGGQKPHLLIGVCNNLGAQTRIEYTPSTRFYLDDMAAGLPWLTRLPFPVHCVSRVEVTDAWRGTTFTSLYRYHHGHFDGVEREFRGFGRVEQIDIEVFRDHLVDQAPVKSVTWYHTGAALDRQRILGQFQSEYFPQRYAARLEPLANPGAFVERALPEPYLPAQLEHDEWREALRACKGMLLRQEIYELEPGSLREAKLYSIASHNCCIQCLQPRGKHRHAVFLVTESEVLTYHHDLPIPAGVAPLVPDPRIAHGITLRHDAFGNPLQTVSIGYPRWRRGALGHLPAPELIAEVQAETHMAYAEMAYTQALALDRSGQPFLPQAAMALRHYRLSLACETLTYELAGLPKGGSFYYAPDDFAQVILSTRYGTLPGAPSTALPVTAKPYHVALARDELAKRLVEQVRSIYFDDASDSAAPTRALDFGRHGPRGLKYQDYKLALTDSLLDEVLGDKLDWATGATPAERCRDVLNDADRSGYVLGNEPHLQGAADQHWMRSGIVGFATDAHRHFFLPERYSDPFGAVTTLTYDPLDLFVASQVDHLDNRTQVIGFDFRLLAPTEIVDANGNHTEMAYDTLGLPVALATKGKCRNGICEADDLAAFRADYRLRNPDSLSVQAFCSTPQMDEGAARSWLASATRRFVYHFGDRQGLWMQQMPGSASIVREQHRSSVSPLQVALECSDGLGQVLMKKVQAEPDPDDMAANPPLRWIVNGLTVLNNKGKAVQQYEPAFVTDFGFEWPRANGVSTITRYDGAGRVVRVYIPDGTYSRVEISPWLIRQFDANDTVLEAGNRWYADSTAAGAAPEVQRAAAFAARHANTPAELHLDSLGREVVAIAHNRTPDGSGNWQDARYLTYTKLDAEGKPLWIVDARGNKVMQYVSPAAATHTALFDAVPDWRSAYDLPTGSVPCYDIAGNPLFQRSMDAGDRWLLNDAAGKPMFAWDSNDQGPGSLSQRHLRRTEYDRLHRPVALWLTIDQTPSALVETFTYVDTQGQTPAALAALQAANLIGQAVEHRDPGGRATVERVDLSGQAAHVTHRLVRPHAGNAAGIIDWSAGDSLLEAAAETFHQLTEYDALGRMTKLFNWHRPNIPRMAIYIPRYNRRGLLASEALITRATAYDAPTDNAPLAIRAIAYNAKGQQERRVLGNHTTTCHAYDPRTFRLIRLSTQRGDGKVVQKLSYVYDPVGNVTHVRDEAQETVWTRNTEIRPEHDYTYDALYRLIEASGRENNTAPAPPSRSEGHWPRGGIPDSHLPRHYTQKYAYDPVGNFASLKHEAGSSVSWVRHYSTQPDSNRLHQTWYGSHVEDAVTYRHDHHGNMLNLNRLDSDAPPPIVGDEQWGRQIRWDWRDMIRQFDAIGGGTATYHYGIDKQRTRKYIERIGGEVADRIYLEGYELYRRTNALGEELEIIESHHLFEGEQRVLLVDDVIAVRAASQPGPNGQSIREQTLFRYQYGNHLGSVGLELDESGQIISYEEFHPYGTSAYRLLNAALEVPQKRYRYTGMERDEESGLGYHGARYYVPWLMRWSSSDPLGVKDGTNLYRYAANSPTSHIDRTGTQAAPVSEDVQRSRAGPLMRMMQIVDQEERLAAQRAQEAKMAAEAKGQESAGDLGALLHDRQRERAARGKDGIGYGVVWLYEQVKGSKNPELAAKKLAKTLEKKGLNPISCLTALEVTLPGYAVAVGKEEELTAAMAKAADARGTDRKAVYGGRGTVLLEELRKNLGFKTIHVDGSPKGNYWNKENYTSDRNTRKSGTVPNQAATVIGADSKTVIDVRVQIDDFVKLGKNMPKEQSDLFEQLKKLPFAVGVADSGFHTFAISYGKVIEIHWDKGPKSRGLTSATTLKSFLGKWGSVVIAVPPSGLRSP